MQRRVFIKNACLACAGCGLASTFATACKGIHYFTSPLEGDRLRLPKSEFSYLRKEEIKYRAWVVVKNERLPFPIGVFRFDDSEYSAVYLKCSHQGCEVQPEGNFLQCPCHGSEFSNRGKLQEGPAEADLTSFLVKTDTDNIYILLK